MDGLSAAASVIAVAQISGQIFALCQNFYAEVKNAGEDIRRLHDEITSLQDVLTNVIDLVDAPGSTKLAILDSSIDLMALSGNAGQSCKV